MATSIDILGNVVCSALFNQVLINKNGYKFGNRKETISSVIGKKKRAGTLSKTGLFLSSILDFLDKNHSLDSIDILV